MWRSEPEGADLRRTNEGRDGLGEIGRRGEPRPTEVGRRKKGRKEGVIDRLTMSRAPHIYLSSSLLLHTCALTLFSFLLISSFLLDRSWVEHTRLTLLLLLLPIL